MMRMTGLWSREMIGNNWNGQTYRTDEQVVYANILLRHQIDVL